MNGLSRSETLIAAGGVALGLGAWAAGSSGVVPMWCAGAGLAVGAGIVGAGMMGWRWRREASVWRDRAGAAEAARGCIEHQLDVVPLEMFVEDFSSVERWVSALREAGVTDIQGHILQDREELRRRFLEVRVVAANRAALDALGVRSLEEVGRRFSVLATPRLLEVFAREVAAVAAGQASLTAEFHLQVADGPERQIAITWNAPRVAGRPDYRRVVVCCADQTGWRETQAKLRQVEDRWQLALAGINAGIWEYNLVTGEVLLSDRWKAILGYAPDEIAQDRREFLTRLHPDDAPLVEALLQQAIRPGQGDYRAEFRMRTKSGEWRWVLSRAKVLFDDNGRPVRMVGSHSDVHARRTAADALLQMGNRYRQLFEASPSPMWVCDAKTQVLLAINSAALEVFGYTEGELTGRSLLELQVEENVVSDKSEVQNRACFRRRDGSTVCLELVVRDHAFDQRPALVVIGRDVTERRVAEERLRSSEARFRALFESAVEGIFESSPDHGLVSANPALVRLLGYASAESLMESLRGRPDGFYLRAGRWAECLALVLAQEVVLDFESEVQCADGSVKWITENLRAVRGEDGAVRYIQGFVSDSTERKRAESALRASEERYRVLFEQSPVAVLEFDLGALLKQLRRLRADNAVIGANETEMVGAAVVGLNRALVDLIGAASEDEARRQVPGLLGDAQSGLGRMACEAVWGGRRQIEGELALPTVAGGRRLVFFRWWLPILEEETAVWSQLVLVDLTAIKRAEADLAAERERLAVTLRAMAEGVITTAADGRILFINEAAAELTGRPVSGAVGRAISEVFVLRQDKAGPPVVGPVLRVMAENRVMDLPRDGQLVRADGRALHVEGRCAPIVDAHQRPTGAILVFRDVTERTRLEAEMLRASKLESVGILAGGIAHDFNNILTVVMGNVTLALLDSQTSSAAGRWLQDAERAVVRARDLTQQLLTFAKGGEPVRSAVRLPEIVKEAVDFALHGSMVRCEFRTAPDLWAADVDRGQISQVVQNLVINAVQAMPGGGVVRVSLSNDRRSADDVGGQLLPAGDYVAMTITDGGHGIQPEHLAKIFDPYFTTKPSGSGLGLATVYSIIKRHRGDVVVESEVGVGTRFRLWLPAAAAPVAPPEVRITDTPSLAGRVLFMDDEETIRTMTSLLLTRLGFEVVVTADGAAAVRAYADALRVGQRFDLVIMDLTVPGGMGGRDAMAELRRIDPTVKAIVSSGYSSDPVMANHQAYGFAGKVPKPYRVADLAETVRSVLAQ